MTAFTLPDGQTIKIDDRLGRQLGQFIVASRNADLVAVGKDLAAKMPMLYGNIQFNLQGGKLVTVNVTECVKDK